MFNRWMENPLEGFYKTAVQIKKKNKKSYKKMYLFEILIL